MCGIFGYYHRDGRSIDYNVLVAMGNAIRHRGPDDLGVYSAHGMAIGNQRLSVIDLEGGHQPFVSDDGQIIVVQNGEIYNYVELAQDLTKAGHTCRTHSDTEVLLRLYETEGINFLHKLNGMFAFAVIDRRENALYIVRDRIGVKPLYFHDDGRQLTFASEIKSILKAGIPRQAMDKEALHHYLSFNYVPAPYTMYEGIRHLMPGHVMKVTEEGAKIWRWWNLADVHPVHGRSEADWIEEFNAIIDDAVRLRLRSDVPFGAFLSGGVDSSTIVGLMARHMCKPVKTFCIGFDDPRYDESVFAQEAADRFGTRHIMERVAPDMLDLWPLATYHCDQPHGDISFLPTYRLSELAVRDVKVVLTGDGGDELFAGYDKYKSFFKDPALDTLDEGTFRRRYFESISLFRHEDKINHYGSVLKQATDLVDSFEVVRPWFETVTHQDRINQALFLDMQLLLSGNNLVKPDRMGMAVSLEARTPFLDWRMMEFAFRMPGDLKLKNGETKYLYKKAVAPLIGNYLTYRKKQMFTVPAGDWFREKKYDYCLERFAFLSSLEDMLDMTNVNLLLSEHVSGSRNRTREIRALISLSHWLEYQ
jgi:asparagine synthase (glutamine-hydrolysing)